MANSRTTISVSESVRNGQWRRKISRTPWSRKSRCPRVWHLTRTRASPAHSSSRWRKETNLGNQKSKPITLGHRRIPNSHLAWKVVPSTKLIEMRCWVSKTTWMSITVLRHSCSMSRIWICRIGLHPSMSSLDTKMILRIDTNRRWRLALMKCRKEKKFRTLWKLMDWFRQLISSFLK